MNCPTCNVSLYDSAQDCKKTDKSMIVDTCITARGNRGYCAHHPSTMSVDSGEVHPTRAQAAKNYAAAEWGWIDPTELRVRKISDCRYRVSR